MSSFGQNTEMSTRKQLARGAKGRAYRDRPLLPHEILGIKVSAALAVLGVKTLYLPRSTDAYTVRQSTLWPDKMEVVLKDHPEAFRITVEVTK